MIVGPPHELWSEGAAAAGEVAQTFRKFPYEDENSTPEIKIMPESNPLTSRSLVHRLTVLWSEEAAAAGEAAHSDPSLRGSSRKAVATAACVYTYIYIYI